MMDFCLAGIDFMVNKEGRIFFIETNSSPGGLYEMEILYGKSEPMERFINFLKSKVKDPIVCMVDSKKGYELDKEEIEWKIKKMDEKMETHFCFMEEQISKKFFIDRDGRKVVPNILITPFLRLKQSVVGCFVVNPFEVSMISIDKFLSTLIVERMTNVEVPKTFLVRRKSEVKFLLNRERNTFKNGFVIKPRFGMFGRGVMIFEDVSEDFEIKIGEYVLQQRIEVEKEDGKFWDVRVFVVNGEFCGGFKRVSEKPIVNIHAGGKVVKLEKDLMKKLKRPSEEIVKAIERFGRLLKSNS